MNDQPKSLYNHLQELKSGRRCFENAFQGVALMILDSEISKVVVNEKTPYRVGFFENIQ